MMVSEPAPYLKRFASVCLVHAIIVESHIVVTEDTVTSDGQIACLCLSEPRFRDVPCRDPSEWTTRPHPDGACWLIDPPPHPFARSRRIPHATTRSGKGCAHRRMWMVEMRVMRSLRALPMHPNRSPHPNLLLCSARN